MAALYIELLGMSTGGTAPRTRSSTDEAVAAYARARLAPAYAAWPYRDLLEERIRNADAARGAGEGRPVRMMSGSAYGCAACHARR